MVEFFYNHLVKSVNTKNYCPPKYYPDAYDSNNKLSYFLLR